MKWNISWRYKNDAKEMKYKDIFELDFKTKKQVRKWWTETHNKYYNKVFIDALYVDKETGTWKRK